MKQLIGPLWIVLCSTLSACVSRDEVPQDPVAPNVVSFTATEYAFQAPDTIPAGWTTFRMANHGQEVHYGHIVRLESGRTVKELLDAYAEAIRTSGPRPQWVTRFGGPGGAAPGDSSSVTSLESLVTPSGGIAAIAPEMEVFFDADITPGEYVFVCMATAPDGRSHIEHGMIQQFTVR